MRTIKFTIHGNQTDHLKGNAIPYHRTTQGSKFSPAHKRYQEWKSYVVGSFVAACIDEGLLNHDDFKKIVYPFAQEERVKPIRDVTSRIKMDIVIGWSDKTHGDGDNVFKGIADALFLNDKYLHGSFDYLYPENKQAYVEVVIYFY